ncbi:MAG: cadherin-like beta sandwich domain-containing protein, partial [Clostridium sp.]
MKKIIGNIFNIMLIVCFFIGMESTLILSTTSKEAYAQIKDEQLFLKSIYISEGGSIELLKDVYSYIVDVSAETEEIFLRAKPEEEDYIVRIDGQLVTSEERYKKDIKLNMGKNKILIEVSNNAQFNDDKYYEETYKEGQDKKSINVKRYTVYVYRGGESAVYLKDMTIDDNNVGFNKLIKSYNLEIDDNKKLAELQLSKFNDNDVIYVNNNILSDSDSLKLKFNGIGKYTVIVDVIDSETKRKGTYTLNIYYGIPVSPNLSDSMNSVLKPNQWVIVNGRWQLNDSLGKPIKNQWFYDDNYKAYFYFNGRGNMKTGWITLDSGIYYLGNDGRMRTGWVKDDGKWYYMGDNGAMLTGWIKDDGDWYNLDENGVMRTGWIKDDGNWYYLNKNGKMRTGWLLEKSKWYY